MTLHRNAKTTPTSRLELVRGVLFDEWAPDAVAEGYGAHGYEMGAPVPRRGCGRAGGPIVPAAADSACHAGRPGSRSSGSSVSNTGCRSGPWPAPCGCPARRAGPGCGSTDSQACRPSRSSATSGRTLAICSTWTSSRWGAFGVWAIGFMGIPGRLHRGRAGSTCMWRWTTIRGWPTSSSWATRRGPPVPPSGTEPSLGTRLGRSLSIAS